jgi:hypothetical protein
MTEEKQEEENDVSLSDAESQDENNDSQSATHEAPEESQNIEESKPLL